MPYLGDLVFPRFPLFCGKFEIVLFFLPVSCYNIGAARYCRKASTPSPEGFFGRKIGMTETIHRRKPVYPFAPGLGFYKIFWVFFLGCIIGVVVETFWCLITKFYIENRSGVIYGPFNPVYGFGAVVLTLGLHWLSQKRDLWIFLGSMVLGGAVEYVCSWVQEMAFGTVSWEYSETPFNLQGRTNLMFAFFWGILGLLWVKDFYPRMSGWIERIPRRVGIPLTWVLLVLMIFNMAISGLAVARWTARVHGKPATNQLEVFLDQAYPNDYLSRVYPNMMVVTDENGNRVI